MCVIQLPCDGWLGIGELFISYGALPNLRLLLLYGFSLPDNPYDSVPLWASMSSQVGMEGHHQPPLLPTMTYHQPRPTPTTPRRDVVRSPSPRMPCRQAPLYELKALTLQRLGLAQCLTQPFHLSLADPLPTSLLAALR